MLKKITQHSINRRKFLLNSSYLLCFAGLPFKKALAGIPTIKSARIGNHPDKTRFVLDMDQQVDFRIFKLTNPDRLVIDLPYSQWPGYASQKGEGIIKAYRFARFNKDTSRIVLDLNHKAIVDDNFLLGPNKNSGNRLVIDLKKDTRIKTQPKPAPETVIAKKETPVKKPEVKSEPVITAQKSTRKIIITLDPGHGGIDPGAIGKGGVYEKTLTLSAAKQAKKLLEQTGKYKVYLTRNRDKSLKLYQRVQIARKYKSDLFISIHADSLKDKTVRGASLYTLAEKASDKKAAELARRENKADLIFDENLENQTKEVANILLDLKRRETLNSSKIFANQLINQLEKKRVNLLGNNHRYAGFAVLKAPDVPSVLLEMGFLSNSYEVKLLRSSSYRGKICSAILKGVEKHFG